MLLEIVSLRVGKAAEIAHKGLLPRVLPLVNEQAGLFAKLFVALVALEPFDVHIVDVLVLEPVGGEPLVAVLTTVA